MKEKYRKISITMRPTVKRQVDILAKEMGMSRSEFIVWATVKNMDKTLKPPASKPG